MDATDFLLKFQYLILSDGNWTIFTDNIWTHYFQHLQTEIGLSLLTTDGRNRFSFSSDSGQRDTAI